MRLYYTTPEKSMTEQKYPSKSLGGYMSSSEVMNDVMGNLFSDISLNMMKDGKPSFRAIVLVNDSDTELENVTLWFSNNSENKEAPLQGKFFIGAVEMYKNQMEEWVTSSVPNEMARPYSIEFSEAVEDAPVTIGNMLPDAHVCLWIERRIDKKACREDYNTVAVQVPENPHRWKEVEKETEEKVALNIEWDN